MKKRLLEILRCPVCRGRLSVEGESSDEAIDAGRLVCTCGQTYPVAGGVPRFVAHDDYVKSFSLEWRRHSKTQLDTSVSDVSEKDFTKKTGLRPEDVKGKLILDAGCGMGRFMDVVQRWGGEVVGVDMSYAVDSAYCNLGNRSNSHIVQADIMHLPLALECFDIIYSIGVLHHTSDCKKAFLSLTPYLRRGGLIGIWVYADYNKMHTRSSNVLRRLTVKIPRTALYYLCYVSVPLYYVYKIPVMGHLLRNCIPISMQKKWDWRVLDTFDWYSPAYQSKHRYPEVHRWFLEAGLSEMELFEPPVGMRGRKL
ncbi:MAG: methyltransferase domain-containing protein [Phycisphaerae bacterium]|nr:methyltransferase domain-containing protein [Phycisphaerae bacterium]